MSAKDFDKVWGYVDEISILEQVDQPELAAAEVAAAVLAVQRTRAQFVADSLALELSCRRDVVLAERERLLGELATVDLQLTQIDTYSPDPFSRIAGDPYQYFGLDTADANRPNVNERRDLLNSSSATNDDIFEAALREPPFVLWMETVSKYEDGPTEYSLTRWNERNREKIQARFGRFSMSSFTRASDRLSRYLGSSENLEKWVREGVLGGLSEQPDRIGLVVNNPRVFFSAAKSLHGYGYKSMLATACIADLQREEQNEVTGRNSSNTIEFTAD